MPKINTIAIVPVPKLSDKLVGTSVGGTPVNQTNNFTLQQLKTLFDGAPVSPNLQAVLNAGNTATQNIYLTGTIDTVNLDVSNDSFLKNLYLSERLFDRNNFQGTNGQYLTSTGTGVQWSTLTIATPTLQQVLTAGNISDKNIITTGNIQAANIEGTNITANTNLRVVGTLSDSSNSVGGSGQVLSSTVTGTDWIDFPSYSAVSPLIYNNVLKQFSIQVATSTQNGYLSSADWITFNGKQNAGNYITALTGEASALGPGSVNITLNNLAVINKTLTGLAISSGVITAADSIITAFGKIQGQINGIVAGVVYQGVWNAATNTPTLTSSVGVQGHYYVVDVAGNTNLNGITDWQVGDWAIYNGTAWQKVDNTDSVTSVNGQTGIVVLNSDNIAEGTTNLYYLDSRARAAISSVATGLTYTSATGVFSLTAGYSIPTVANQTNWTTAYNDSIVSAAVTGTTTKTLTLTQQDGGTITASWTDIDTNLVTSVFGRTGAVVAQAGDYSTTLVTEGTNLYYLDSRARSAISSSATGLTYTTATGVFSFTAGYSIPTDASQSNWTTAYNDSITSAAVTGTTTKTLTLNQQDGGTITASWTDLDTGLTSVGVSMPSAFNVTNSPLTSNGTIAVTGAGTASQYVRGDGTLGDFPTGGGGGGASVSYYLNGSINQGTFGGNTYYQMSKTPILGTGTDFSTSVNGYIAQFITDVGTPDALLIPGGNWNFETYFSASSGGGSPTFYIELYKYDGATFTLIASNSSNPELIAFGTTINPYYNSLAVPETILLATDRLAIRIYVFTSGRTITLHTENSHLCQAITTFTTGLTALNGLTKQIQYFSVGTSGTDFNISSSVATHTFNLPTASAVNRGALSAADWSTFNAKQNALTLTTTGSSGASTLVGATLNVPTYTLSGLGGVPTSRQLTINGTAFDLSADRSWSVGTVTSVGLSSATSGVTIGNTPVTGSGTITLAIATATSTQQGLLSSTDWSTFNNKQNAITLTTTGTSGAATLVGATLNIPQYQAAGTYVTSVTASSPLASSGGTTPNITIQQASGSQSGFLSSTDWTTFNNKQNALTNPVTGTGASGQVAYFNGTTSITSESALFWDATNDRLGIGITNPFGMFHAKSAGAYGAVLSDNTGATGGGYFASLQNGSTKGIVAVTGAIEGNTTSDFGMFAETGGALRFYVNGSATRVMSLTSSGNLLVGTTTDNGARLQVDGVVRTTNKFVSTLGNNQIVFESLSATTGYQYLQLLNNTAHTIFGIEGTAAGSLLTGGSANASVFTTVGNTNLEFGTNQVKRLTIAASTGAATFSSNVAAGSTSSGAQINVFASSYGNNGLFNAYGTDNLIKLQIGALGTNEGFIFTGSGNKISFFSGGNLALTLNSNQTATFSSSVTADSLLVQRTASRNMLGISSIALPTSGAEEGVAVVKTNSNLWQMSLVGYAVDSKGMRVYNTGGAGYTSFEVAQGAGTRFIVDGVGNVGIGTASPTFRLDVQNNTQAVTRVLDTSTNASLILQAGSGSAMKVTAYNYASSTALPLYIQVDGANTIMQAGGGNLLVGTTSDNGARLQVSGAIYASDELYLDNGKYLRFRRSSGNLSIQTLGIPSGTDDVRLLTTGDFNVLNGSLTNLMTVKNGGNVLIGTTTDVGDRVNVNGSIRVPQTFFFRYDGDTGLIGSGSSITGGSASQLGIRAASDILFATNGANERMRINSSGNVLIGTTTDNGAKLNVNGTIRSNDTNGLGLGSIAGYRRIQYGSDNATSFTLLTDGNAYAGLYASSATFSSSVTAANFNAVSSNPFLIINDTSGSAAGQLQFQNNGTQKWNFATQATSNDLGLYNNGGTNSFNLYIKHSSGNVGIGTTSPEELLDIRGANRDETSAQYNQVIYSTSTHGMNRGGSIGLGGTTNGTSSITAFGAIKGGKENDTAGNTAGVLSFLTRVNAGPITEKMRITSGGNVGIGTSSGFNQISGTETTLKIANSNAASLYLEVTGVRGYANYVGAGGNMVWYDYTASASRMTLTSSGNVLIGTTTDVGATLYVNGTIRTGTLTAGTQTAAVDWRLGNARGGAATNNALIRVQINGVLVDLLGNYV